MTADPADPVGPARPADPDDAVRSTGPASPRPEPATGPSSSPSRSPATDLGRAIEAIWRIESAKVTARLARLVGDVATAEDLAQDTFLAALRRWPTTGIPDVPGAWLHRTARHLAIDLLRRRDTLARKHAQLGVDPDTVEDGLDAVLAESVGDDLLGLLFMACHPVLSPEARVALTLRLLGGLRTDEIARAQLTTEATVAQRIVRAKRKLADAQVTFELPGPAERAERLASVLEVIYLIFNEGYAATSGDDWMRTELASEAMRLGRILAEVAPDDPEVHGLLALMELQASRMRARTGPDGSPILLLEQDRGRWDQLLIRRGLAGLDRVEALGGTRGPYALQAAIAAVHARARTAEETDWALLAARYDTLSLVAPSPVVEVNRAVALGRAYGPAAGLALADELVALPQLARYHLVFGVRADLLDQLDRPAEARADFVRAAELTRNERERAEYLRRARACADRSTTVEDA